MSFIKNKIDSVIMHAFPDFYWYQRIKHFDSSSIIYKRESYQSFLDQAFRDFRPEISDSQRKSL